MKTKKTMENVSTNILKVRLPGDWWPVLTRAAAANGGSPAAVIREAVREKVARVRRTVAESN